MTNDHKKNARGLGMLLDTLETEMQELELAKRDVYDLYEYWSEADEDDTEASSEFIHAAYAYIRKLENVNRLETMAIVNMRAE